MITDQIGKYFEELIAIIAKLRDPEKGCPWDIKQTHESLTPFLLEESHELIDAIHNLTVDEYTSQDRINALKNELGDVLLQVLLHSQIAHDSKNFSIGDVAAHLSKKLIERHPHVFGDVKVKDEDEVMRNWEQIKKKERETLGKESSPEYIHKKSILDGLPKGLPALLMAQRVSERAARVGFEWATIEDVIKNAKDEIQEFVHEYKVNSREDMEMEIGDVFFSLTQICRRLKIDSETALKKSTDKFIKRFKALEERAEYAVERHTFDELSGFWDEIKMKERNHSSRT
jgi:tetrapyrrole methylase family protein / MazG family protein